MTNEPKAGGLDPEMLAAYLDQRLPPAARAAVEAQLAADPDSYELLVELIHANEALKGESPAEGDAVEPQGRTGAVVPLVPKSKRARGWAIAGGVLAVAAAVVLVVRLQPELLQRLRGGEPVDPLMAKLVDAVGEERYVEARLTGGFKYGPLRSVTRGPGDLSQQNLALLAAAGEAQKRAQEDPTAVSLHAWGIAQVLLADYDGAIATLRTAASASGASSEVLADLSAALLARAINRGNAADLPAALEASEAALAASDQLHEARYNRALSLELLNLRDAAVTAWRDYLARHPQGPWADEAKRRLERMTSDSARADPFEPPMASDTVAGSALEPSRVRFLFERSWMLSLCHSPGDAALRQRLQAQAGSYAIATQDRQWIEVLNQPTTADACNAYSSFANGLAQLDSDDLPSAKVSLGKAAVGFREIGSSLSHWADYHLATIDSLSRQFEPAEGALRRTLGAAGSRGQVSLEAHTLWTLGVLLASDNRARESLAPLTLALSRAVLAKEPVLQGRLENQLADVHDYFGDGRLAWQRRQSALLLAAQVSNRRLRHSVYGSAAAVTSRRDLLFAAAAFLEAQYDANRDAAPPVSMLTLTLRQADLALARNDYVVALEKTDEAQRILATVAADPRVASLSGRVATTQARLSLGQNNIPEAIQFATTAMTLLGTGRDLALTDALLIRARALQLDNRSGEAIGDLRQVVSLLQRRRGTGDTFFGSPEIAAIHQGVEDVLGHAEVTELSLELADEMRRLIVPVDGGGTPLRMASADVSTVFLNVLGTKTLAWLITTEGAIATELPVSRQKASELVREARSATQVGAEPGVAHRRLAAVFSAILGPLYSRIPRASVIRMVADAPLDGLPYAALINPETGRFLIEDHTVVTAPTVAARRPRVEHSERALDLLAIADPLRRNDEPTARLSWSAREAAAIAPMYRRSALLSGAEATAVRVLHSAPDARIVHFATHAVVDRVDGRRSRLLLADDENSSVLTGEELLRQDWGRVEVVVLAACATAEPDGRLASPITLAGQVLASGPSHVIATLTPIEDRLADRFFVELHRYLAAGLAAPEALRRTQLLFINRDADESSRGQSLGLWSPIIVVGS